jgi:serine/threonine-protein kinase
MSSDSSAKRPARAKRLGKYEVVAHIATGGMGAVYKAIDSVLKREVALKLLPPDMASQPEALERFRREARNAARLRHENIVTIYEFDQFGNIFYLAMEFIDGIDLLEYIRRKGRLDPEEARVVTIQAARALEHAHAQGVVHRDVKPSNFLVSRKGDSLVVKMSDFGLARETSDEDGRVTRDGHTVGTVDYMSPEQARNSRSADCRSDIYSLGCTLYHMLAGKAPFAGGSITERLCKHAEDEPPDLRQFNPRISEALCAVVRRMLAKNPAERYPTPGALLRDLIRLESATDPLRSTEVLAGLALAAGEKAPKAKQQAPAPPHILPPPQRRFRRRAPAAGAAPGPPSLWSNPWTWGLGGVAIALVLAGVGIVVLLRSPRSQPDPVTDVPPPPRILPPNRESAPVPQVSNPSPEPVTSPAAPSKPDWPALYKPSVPLAREAVLGEFLRPWAQSADPGPDTPVLRVSRTATGEGVFPSLDAACAAATTDRLTVIEIDDNGPIFQTPVAVASRRLVIRGRNGCRPLLIWDAERSKDEIRPAKDEPVGFLSLARGSLTLDGLDVACKWPDAASGRPYLVRVTAGDFLARDCTFSLAGGQPARLGVVRFERGEAASFPAAVPARCRLSRCVARGPGLVVLDLDYPGAEVLLDACLLIGTDQPLLQVAGRTLAPTVLRLLRSTLVAGQAVLQVRPTTANDTRPELDVRAWDVLLARGDSQPGGQMVALANNSRPAKMRWQAINSLYTGWRTLLASGDGTIDNVGAWQSVWQRTEGDLALAPPWPAVARPDPSEVAAEEYRTQPPPATPVGYAATSGPGPLGCDPATLPPVRTSWQELLKKPGRPPH